MNPQNSTAWWRSVLLLTGVLLVTTLTPFNLQAGPQVDEPSAPLTVAPQRQEHFRRLIVKYKDDGTERVSGRAERRSLGDGAERANRLNEKAQAYGHGHRATTLTHLKSINANSQVLLSNVAMTRSEMHALAKNVAQDPSVAYAEIDEPVYPLFVPNDSSYASQQWNLKTPAAETGASNMPNAWGRSFAGNPLNGHGVTVAVLDTGYRPHSELSTNLTPTVPTMSYRFGYDFVLQDSAGVFTTANDGDSRDADATDPGDWNTVSTDCDLSNSSWHGTRVAGIIGAEGNNSAGIIGVAHGATILPVRVMGVCGGYTSDIAAGIEWAIGNTVSGVSTNTTHPAKVLNLSLGNRQTTCSVTFQNAINSALAANVTVVVATGNEASFLGAPANCTGVIAVSAHTRAGDIAYYSNLGIGTAFQPTLSAPGGGTGLVVTGDNSTIYAPSNSGTTAPVSDSFVGGKGTSFATPQVAGVAALLYQLKPTITPTEVKTYLTSTARSYPSGTYCYGRSDCGAGMLDGFKASQALMLAQGTPNHAPAINAIGAKTVGAGGSLSFTATATDIDGDEVSFVASGLPSGASFNAVTGTFSWGYALPGNYTVTLTPTDGADSGSATTVNIAVTGSLPAAPSSGGGGGGGGGAMELGELLALLCMGLSAAWLRRRVSLPGC